ncbi:MAG: asparagine synthase (glutamine-hydrolyzing) [Bacillota bacterium]
MCGIVGIIDYHSDKIESKSVEYAASILSRRGPDDKGLWEDKFAILAHRRLSVLDITQAGHQPMISEDGRYIIVFNGEIYNFKEVRKMIGLYEWKSNSDTEVILAAYSKWGTKCLKYFDGMFAFVIWDKKEEVLFAARDRMGVKPFYYYASDSCFAFSSRPRPLFSLSKNISKDIDEQALRFYLEIGYIPGSYSIYKDIHKLPPAHFILFSREGLRIEPYWEFKSISPEVSWENRSEEDLLDELDEIISRSVKSRMVSDVPLGAFLSGGIDSSLVVAMMSKHCKVPVKTFTIGFNEKRYDESPHAQVVSDYLRTEHFCEYMQVDSLLSFMPMFSEEFDEPFFDSSAFPVMAVSKLAREHVTVSLSGDGGDELFGGYHYYLISEQLSPVFKLPKLVRKGFASAVGMIPKHQFKLLAGAMQQPSLASAFAFSRSIAKDFGSVLVPEVLGKTIGLSDLFSMTSKDFTKNISPSESAMRLDALYTLPDDYLQKVDVASMAFSLESRDPLLSLELVEWAMKLPKRWKLYKGQNKYLLRKLAYRYVPESIINRPKQGFSVPIDEWLRGPLKDWAYERCNDSRLFSNIPLNQSKVIELLELHESGRRNVHPLLWAILMFLDFYSNTRSIS